MGNGTFRLSAGFYIAVTSCTELKRLCEGKLACVLVNLPWTLNVLPKRLLYLLGEPQSLATKKMWSGPSLTFLLKVAIRTFKSVHRHEKTGSKLLCRWSTVFWTCSIARSWLFRRLIKRRRVSALVHPHQKQDPRAFPIGVQYFEPAL